MFHRTLRDYGDDDDGEPIKICIPKSLRKIIKPAKGWKIKKGYLIKDKI